MRVGNFPRPPGTLAAFTIGGVLASRRGMKRALVALFVAACSRPAATPCPPARPNDSTEIVLAAEIQTACDIHFADDPLMNAVGDGKLLAADRDTLRQTAACFAKGPLKGQSLRLVGRGRVADVRAYLAEAGLDPGKIDVTSGDPSLADRRVDILLAGQ